MNQTIEKDAELFETLRILDELNNGEMDRRFDEIIQFLEGLYIQNTKEWIVMYSGGKDSTLVLLLIWEMLKRMPAPLRVKKVHVIAANTKVETNKMTSYLKKNIKMIEESGEGLNIKVHLVQPEMKDSFFWNVIGRGVVPPKPPSPFQWCTKKMKINPMNIKMNQILSEIPFEFGADETPYDVMMFLGSRLDESTKRANSINKFTFSEQDIFANHSEYKNVRVCYPIKFVKTSDLWAYITSKPTLPWGLESLELFEMYADGSGECPMTREELEKAKGCGSSSSRNGCWVCLYAGRVDKMLNGLIQTGNQEINYLAKWKAFLYDVVYDVRYREPLRRREVETAEKYIKNPTTENEDLFDLALDEDKRYYKNYLRADKSEYEPGGFTFELRLILLQKLLYTQAMVGYDLIEVEEIEAILRNWKEEGYEFEAEDIVPLNHQYDGAVVLKPDGKINEKETKNQNTIFEVGFEFRLNRYEVMDYVKERQKITGRSIYCYFEHKDYEREGVVYNYLRFVVCHPSIKTEIEAHKFVFKWLFQEGKKESKDRMTERALKAGIKFLTLSAIGEAIENNRNRS